MLRSTPALLGLFLVSCMNEPPPKTDASELAAPASAAEPGSAEPPDPPGYVAPLVYGRDPPRAGPIERSSVWTVHGPGDPISHTVACDTMEVPELREVLRVLFAGASPSDAAPVLAPDASLVLKIDWREQGEVIAVSELYSDGTLVRDEQGKRTTDAKLDGEGLAAVETAIEGASLRDPAPTWCPSPTP